MAEPDVALVFARHETRPPAKRPASLTFFSLSVSALAHGAVLFALVHSQAAQMGADVREIPVEIVVEAGLASPAAAAPAPAQAKPAKIKPSRTPATAENKPPPRPAVDHVEPATAAAKTMTPRPTASAPSLPPRPVATRPPASRQQARVKSETRATRHRRNERRRREKAEIRRKEQATVRKRTEAKKREERRAEARTARAHHREAARKRFARARALSRFRLAPRTGHFDYRSAVLRHLAAFKEYPESARERGADGRAIVRFTLDRTGHVVSVRIVRSSGQADIDAATLAMVRRAEPFPAPPRGAPRSFSAAIEFRLE